MQQVQFNGAEKNNNNQFLTPVKRKVKPRKWREIEELKAKILLEKELREIDASFSFSQSELS